VLGINPVGEQYKVFVIHQAAGRFLRRDILSQMKKIMKELDPVDLEELAGKAEKEAEEMEKKFLLQCFVNSEDESLRVPYFDYERS